MFVTASPAQGLEQAASGARVIGPLGSGTDASAVRGELAAARDAGPLTLPELRVRLRGIFAADATPARLTALMKAAGLPGSLVGGRQLGVLVSLADAAQAGRLAATLLAQRLRPAEVIASCPASAADAVRSALGPLRQNGIRVEIAPDAAQSAAGVDWARPLARLARAPWLAPWAADGGQPEDYLLDLACARECAQADAVGFAALEYEFTRWLEEPALVRAHLLDPGGPAASDWGSHGLRLFSVTR